MLKIKLSKNQKQLRQRIIEISYNNKLSHIGSCLNAIDLIDGVYRNKNKNDIFILSAGHSAVALFAVIEKYKKEKIYDTVSCFHPDRPTNSNMTISSGSLGHGLPISVGVALASPQKKIYCLISDGECAEGSIWESLRIIIEKNITNLTVIVSANGYGAYDKIDKVLLRKRIEGFGFLVKEIEGHDEKVIDKVLKTQSEKPLLIFAHTDSEQLPFLMGQNAHYYVMNDDLRVAEKAFS